MREVFTGYVYQIKIYDDKCDIVKLKNNASDKKSKLETQDETLELEKEKEPIFEESIAERTKLRDQKLDKQLDATDMSELESEESAAQNRNQQGKGLKILIPYQILIRVPISLAQLKAGNVRQMRLTNLFFSLLTNLILKLQITKILD